MGVQVNKMKMFNFTKDQLIIGGMPMPPTTNQLYSTFTNRFRGNPGAGQTRRVPSKTYQAYKKDMELWRLKSLGELQRLDHWMKYDAWDHDLQATKIYRFDRYFCFKHSQVWTKAGKIKKMDATNRIKAFDDVFCSMINIDDSQIWTGIPEKITLPEFYEPCVILKIRPTKAKTWDNLKNVLHLNQDI